MHAGEKLSEKYTDQLRIGGKGEKAKRRKGEIGEEDRGEVAGHRSQLKRNSLFF
jgi:hypothetical protein